MLYTPATATWSHLATDVSGHESKYAVLRPPATVMYLVMNHVIPRYIHPLWRHWLKSKPPMYLVMNHVIPRYIHPLSRHWAKIKTPMYVVMNRGMRCYVHSPRWHWPQSRMSHAAADAWGRWCSGSWRAWWSPRPPPGQRWCWVAPQTSSRSATRRKHVRPVSVCTARSYISLKTNSCTACTRRAFSIASLKTAITFSSVLPWAVIYCNDCIMFYWAELHCVVLSSCVL